MEGKGKTERGRREYAHKTDFQPLTQNTIYFFSHFASITSLFFDSASHLFLFFHFVSLLLYQFLSYLRFHVHFFSSVPCSSRCFF